MLAFLLLRNNIESGPYSLEELKLAGIWSTDLLWIEGRSNEWQSPDKIEEIRPFVYETQKALQDNSLPNFSLPVYQQDGESPGKRINSASPSSPLLQKENNQTVRPEEAEEKQKIPEGRYQQGSLSEQVSRRSLEIRKNLLSRKDPANSINHQETGSKKEENQQTEAGSKPIKVIIADDHQLFREGVKMALSQKKDISIIAEAENGAQLLQQLNHYRPDVILLDIQMPLVDGISALASIRKLYGNLKVVILTMHEGHSMVSALMEKGANAYLTKTADPEAIYQAIKTCYAKDFYFNELTNISMLEGLRSKNRIPERTATPIFDGAGLMRQLTEAQKKSTRNAAKNTKGRVALAGFSILLVAAGIIIGKTMISNSQITKTATADIPAKQALKNPAQTPAVSKNSPETSVTVPIGQNKVDPSRPDDKALSVSSDKKSVPAKHGQAKTTDLQILPRMQEIRKIDSTGGAPPETGIGKTASAEEEARGIARNNIRLLVTASLNNYHKGLFGSHSDIELTVYNRSAYKIDEVTVEIKYLRNDSTIYRTASLDFLNIPPASNQVLEAPKSPKGVKLEYRILAIKSGELGL